MVKVKYGQIQQISQVLSGDQKNPGWWHIAGLSWDLLQTVDNIIATLDSNSATFAKMKQKLIDDYAVKDEAGQVVTLKTVDGQPTDIPSFGENHAIVDERWLELVETEFDCPALAPALLEKNADKLGMTLAAMRMIKPIIAQDLAA